MKGLGERMFEHRKVPGPWKDEPIDESEDSEAIRRQALQQEAVLDILKKKELYQKIRQDQGWPSSFLLLSFSFCLLTACLSFVDCRGQENVVSV